VAAGGVAVVVAVRMEIWKGMFRLKGANDAGSGANVNRDFQKKCGGQGIIKRRQTAGGTHCLVASAPAQTTKSKFRFFAALSPSLFWFGL
jgi:hypothetical protein